MKVRDYLKDSILLFDGSMGMLYSQRSARPFSKSEEGNLKEPDIITEIHKTYIEAGAKAIKTNTYGANKPNMECDSVKLEKIIDAAWKLAADAVGDRDVYIFADIGPIAEENGETDEQYKEIIDNFIKLGAENFLFETFGSAEPILFAAEYIRQSIPNAFIIASYAVNPDGFSIRGEKGENLLEKTIEASLVDAIGFNCVSGPANLQKLVEKISIEGKIISVMPNAGLATVVGRRTVFSNNPEYYAQKMIEIANLGVKILGGCCGTNPEFIRQISNRLSEEVTVTVKSVTEKKTQKSKNEREPEFLKKLEKGKKIIAVELDPPASFEFEKYLAGANAIKAAGADLITIADNPVARSCMDSCLIACKLKRELGIEPLPHMTCRDRNLNATKSLLFGLNMEGVNQALIVTGDPIPQSEREAVKSVYNFNSRMLISYINGLNETLFQNPIYLCGALNINAKSFDAQLRLAEKKVAAGVKMLFTQPVLSDNARINLERARKSLDIKIMGGIMPVVSYRNACFMNNEISGIDVSPEITERYRDKDREESTRLAVEISTDIARSIYDIIDGYYIITPFSRTDIVCKIISAING